MDSFTIRYQHPYGVVRVQGRVHEEGEASSTIHLVFHEERTARTRVLLLIAVGAVTGAILNPEGGDWIAWAGAALLAVLMTFIPRHTASLGFQQLVCSSLAEQLLGTQS